MTVGSMLTQTWKLLGEPSDLDPDTTLGRGYLIDALNQGQNAVAMWKDPVHGRLFRWNDYRSPSFISYTIPTGTIAAVSGTSLTLESESDADMTGALIVAEGETRVVTTNSAENCTINEAFSAAVTTSSTYAIYRPWITIPSTINYIEVLKVENFDQKTELGRLDPSDVSLATAETTGTPTGWYRVGRRLYLNQAPDEATLFRFWYFHLPAQLTSSTTDGTVIDIPLQYHFGVILWAVYWGYQWMQEPTEAYAAQERFKNYMRTVQTEYDVKDYMNQDFTLEIKVL